MIKYLNLEIKSINEENIFEGYASVFNVIDLHNDLIKKGSFKYSLNTKKNNDIHMLFQHDISKPIGHWVEIKENNFGLYVKGKILTTLHMGNKIIQMIKNNFINGLSIGFIPIITHKQKGKRIIFQADLHEISIVKNPANLQACFK